MSVSKNFILLVVMHSITLPVSLYANRLRFIIANQSETNLFACLRTHDCNPLDEVEMPPDTRENIYTENFTHKAQKFQFKLQTNSEKTNYEVFYNNQAKILQLKRNGIVFDEINYNTDYATDPIVITIDDKLDASLESLHTYMEGASASLNKSTTTRSLGNHKDGYSSSNSSGYKPSSYLGMGDTKELRKDQNRFCPKNSASRSDLASLSAYVGKGNVNERHDNLNPFCKTDRIGKWSKCRSCPQRTHVKKCT